MDRKQFTVVMRGPSAVLFKQNEHLAIEKLATEVGLVNITYTSRWLKIGEKMTVPGHLWIEITGSGQTLKEVLLPFANTGLSVLPILSKLKSLR